MVSPDDDFDETTDGPDVVAAQRALRQAKSGSVDTAKVISEMHKWLGVTRDIGNKNHFTDKFREIIQGG